MEYKEALEITRNFTKFGIKYSPFLAADWTFELVGGMVHISSLNAEMNVPFTTAQKYTTDFIFNNSYVIVGNQLQGAYYLTSKGLFSEREYNEALEIVEIYENNISKDELIVGNMYKTNKVKEVVYLGEVEAFSIELVRRNDKEYLIRKTHKTRPLLYNVEAYEYSDFRIISLSSVKIVKDLNKVYNTGITLNYQTLKSEYLFNNNTYYVDFKNVNNIVFCGSYSLERFKKFENYVDIQNFPDSEKTEIELIPAEVKPNIENFFYHKIKIEGVKQRDIDENIIKVLFRDKVFNQVGNKYYTSENISLDIKIYLLNAFFSEIYDNINRDDERYGLLFTSQAIRTLMRYFSNVVFRNAKLKRAFVENDLFNLKKIINEEDLFILKMIFAFDWRDYKHPEFSPYMDNPKAIYRGGVGFRALEEDFFKHLADFKED